MIRASLILIAALLATACASKVAPPAPTAVLVKQVILTRDVPRISVVRTEAPPQTKPCSATAAAAPAYPDGPAALRNAPTIYEQVQLLLAGRALRMERERALTESLRRCNG